MKHFLVQCCPLNALVHIWHSIHECTWKITPQTSASHTCLVLDMHNELMKAMISLPGKTYSKTVREVQSMTSQEHDDYGFQAILSTRNFIILSMKKLTKVPRRSWICVTFCPISPFSTWCDSNRDVNHVTLLFPVCDMTMMAKGRNKAKSGRDPR